MFYNFEEERTFFNSGKEFQAAPVDGHHPMDIERKVYPHLGRKLTDKDKGKYVLRTFPFKGNEYYDWSYVPSWNDLNRDKHKLVSLENGIIKIFRDFVFEIGNKKENWNDGNWCTKKEWKKHQKSLLEKETEKETEKPKVEDFDIRLNLSTDDLQPIEDMLRMFFRYHRSDVKNVNLFETPQFFGKDLRETWANRTRDVQNEIFGERDPCFEQCPPPTKTPFIFPPQPLRFSTQFNSSSLPFLPAEFREWLAGLLKRLPKQTDLVGAKDYSFRIISQPGMSEPQDETHPDFFSNDPYEVLGLNSQEKDLDLIKKQYKKLALKFHPDKNQGQDKIFKRINKAYKKLTEELEVSPTVNDFLSASNVYDALKAKTMSLKVSNSEMVLLWENFLKDLRILRLKDQEKAVKILLNQLYHKANGLIHFYSLKIEMEKITPPAESLSVSDKILHLLQNKRQIMKTVSFFDDTVHEIWKGGEESGLILIAANWDFMDKFIAQNRSLAELYAFQDRKDKVFEIRNESLKFYKTRKEKMNKNLSQAEFREMQRTRKLFKAKILSETKNESPHFKEKEIPTGFKTETLKSKEKETGKKENRIRISKKKTSKKPDYTAIEALRGLMKNTKENRDFFKKKN